MISRNVLEGLIVKELVAIRQAETELSGHTHSWLSRRIEPRCQTCCVRWRSSTNGRIGWSG